MIGRSTNRVTFRKTTDRKSNLCVRDGDSPCFRQHRVHESEVKCISRLVRRATYSTIQSVPNVVAVDNRILGGFVLLHFFICEDSSGISVQCQCQ